MAAVADEHGHKPLVSVVIPTRNRSRLLREAIESLWEQTIRPQEFEIIVVDNCSTDDTSEVIRELQSRSPCRLIYHVMPENRGPAHSRNTGVGIASGEIVAFTDSDCRMDPEWLKHGVRALEENVAFAVGSILDKPEQRVRFFSRANTGGGGVTKENPTYPTCNIFYRRKVFLDMGGFDESLCFQDFRNRPVECADTDLAWRMKEKGYCNVFVREMLVYHEVETLTPMNWILEPLRLFVVPALVRRHPVLRKILLQWNYFFYKSNILFYLALIGLILGVTSHFLFAGLVIPFLWFVATMGNNKLSLSRVPIILGRSALLTARQLSLCAGLIYGSLRFRRVVL